MPLRPPAELRRDLRFWASRRLGRSFAPPDWLSINLTLRCNLSCTMCTTCYDAPELSTGEVLDLVDQAADWGVPVFNPLGGEPFVRQDLEQILQHAARRGLQTTLTTNGTLLTPPRAAAVARVPSASLHLNFSIDGLEEAHDRVRGAGSFRRTMAGYRHLREADAAAGNPARVVGANVLLHRGNVHQFRELLGFLAAEGFEGVQVLQLFRDERDPTVGGMWFLEEELDEVERVVAWLVAGESPLRVRNPPDDLRLIARYYREGLRPLDAPCWAGWKELYVNADGSAIMCDGKLDFLAGRYGSVRERTLRELWSSPDLQARREVVKRCTTPCLQGCYLRRESDHLGTIARSWADGVRRGAEARLGPLLPRRYQDEVLTVELTDVPDHPGHPLLERVFARSPVSVAAALADPARLPALRDQGYLDFGRGFLGVELLDRVLAELARARLRFRALALRWRGEPLLHPALTEVLGRVAGAVGAGTFGEVVLHTSGRLGRPPVPAGVRLAAAGEGAPGEDDWVVTWDARLTRRRDVRVLDKVGNVLEEGFAEVWARR